MSLRKNKEQIYSHIKIDLAPVVKCEEQSIFYKYACFYSTKFYKNENIIMKLLIMFFYGKLKIYISFIPLFTIWFNCMFFITFGLTIRHIFLELSLIVLLLFVLGITFIRLKCQTYLDEYDCYNRGLVKQEHNLYRFFRDFGEEKDFLDLKKDFFKRNKKDYIINKINWHDFKESFSVFLDK